MPLSMKAEIKLVEARATTLAKHLEGKVSTLTIALAGAALVAYVVEGANKDARAEVGKAVNSCRDGSAGRQVMAWSCNPAAVEKYGKLIDANRLPEANAAAIEAAMTASDNGKPRPWRDIRSEFARGKGKDGEKPQGNSQGASIGKAERVQERAAELTGSEKVATIVGLLASLKDLEIQAVQKAVNASVMARAKAKAKAETKAARKAEKAAPKAETIAA